ncbi:MAG: hypothetical protein H6745_29240 [Deltaproteobacteria bacterium]|nr:hypothetical protein [Deltaproteobacteria bacterium]
MKATIEIPDDLYRRTKAHAALLGRPLNDVVADALRAQLAASSADVTAVRGWRSVFGVVPPGGTADVDEAVKQTFGQVHPQGWE